MQGNKWYLHGKVHYKLSSPPNYQFEQIILLLSYSTILQTIGLIFKTKDCTKPATPWTALAPTGSSILSQTETELPWIWILTDQIVAPFRILSTKGSAIFIYVWKTYLWSAFQAMPTMIQHHQWLLLPG